MMRGALWLVLVIASFLAGLYAPLFLYALAALIIFPAASAVINFLDKGEISASSETVTAKKGETISVKLKIFGNGCKVRGEIVCENILTHTKSASALCCTAEKDGAEVRLEMTSRYCGEIEITLENLRRYDCCGLSYKKMKPCQAGKVIALPEGNSDVSEEIRELAKSYKSGKMSAEYEVCGSKEYADGEELRHINHKLTHRFGKIYIKEYSHSEPGKICLFFDGTYRSEPEVFDSLAEGIRAASGYLAQEGIVHYIGHISQGEVCCGRVENGGISPVLHDLLTEKTFEGDSQLGEFSQSCGENISEIVCFSAHGQVKESTGKCGL